MPPVVMKLTWENLLKENDFLEEIKGNCELCL